MNANKFIDFIDESIVELKSKQKLSNTTGVNDPWSNDDDWENDTIDSYLNAIVRVSLDIEGVYFHKKLNINLKNIQWDFLIIVIYSATLNMNKKNIFVRNNLVFAELLQDLILKVNKNNPNLLLEDFFQGIIGFLECNNNSIISTEKVDSITWLVFRDILDIAKIYE